MSVPRISLEQWAAFKAVVEEGSFAAAAEALNKSQSTISYAIRCISTQLPIELFEKQGRKAELTAAGQSLYRHAKQLLHHARDTELTAELLASGWEPEITLAADIIISLGPVMGALESLSRQAPMTRVRLLETSLSATDEALLERKADIVLTPEVLPGFLGTPLTVVSMIPVSHPDHPLGNTHHEVSSSELSQHRQIVVRDTGIRRQKDSGWLGSEQRWTVSHFSSSIDAVKRNLGFAFLPEAMICGELGRGDLVKIKLAQHAERRIQIYLVVVHDTGAGKATQALASEIVRHFL